MSNKEERKCKKCGKTLVGKNKYFCSGCKKEMGDTGVNILGVVTLVGGAAWTAIKAFTKKN